MKQCMSCNALYEGAECPSCGATSWILSESESVESVPVARNPLNAWLSMWVAPKATIRQILREDATGQVLLLASCSGVAQAFTRAHTLSLGDRIIIETILFLSFTLGAVGGILALYLSGLILRWTGALFGGKASAADVRAAIAWSSLPTVLQLPLWILLITVYRSDLFKSAPIAPQPPLLETAVTCLFLAQVVLLVWQIVLLIGALQEVHGFAVWRSISSILLPSIAIGTIIFFPVLFTYLRSQINKYYATKKYHRVDLTNSIGMQFVNIPAGAFDRPSEDTKKQFKISISKPFYICLYEVTQGQYSKVMGSNPSKFPNRYDGQFQEAYARSRRLAGLDSSRLPVERVSWYDAVAFCKRLSEFEEEKAAGRTYRLPTVAEWEYACLAGRDFGHAVATLSSRANVKDMSLRPYGRQAQTWDDGYPFVAPVGSFIPNEFGLYDMLGNVHEWCNDWYGPIPAEPMMDPQGPITGTNKLARGEAWNSEVTHCSPFTGLRVPPETTYMELGFRVLVEVSEQQ